MKIKCAYIKCNNYFEPFGSKKCCSRAHNALQWVINNPERRKEINTKYERKIGKIPRKEWAELQKGKNNRNYTGKAFRTNKESWRKLALEIKIRDDMKCQFCERKINQGMRLAVHHIVPYDICQDDSKDNLITLCQACHLTTHQFYKKNGGALLFV